MNRLFAVGRVQHGRCPAFTHGAHALAARQVDQGQTGCGFGVGGRSSLRLARALAWQSRYDLHLHLPASSLGAQQAGVAQPHPRVFTHQHFHTR